MYGEDVTFSGLPAELRTRRRRLLLLVIGLIVLLAAGLVAMLALAPGGRPAAAPGEGTGGLGSAPLEPNGGDGSQPGAGQTPAPTEDADGGAGPGDGGTSGEGEGGQGTDDGGNTPDQPSGPCATTDRKLAGAPDPLHLKPGANKGSFTIYNCTDEQVAWLAATKPSVTLADEDGTLAPGATLVMSFTVDTSKFDTQTFTFKIKVYSTTSTFFYVDVNGSKLGIAPN
jgi:hypothetical protein